MKAMKLSALAATLLAGAALTAHANEPKAKPEFESITRVDFIAQAVERFDAMDADKDGVLTRQELREAFRAHMLEHKKEFKREHRGADSKAEKRERHEKAGKHERSDRRERREKRDLSR